jgi:hypothetical protein
MQFRIILNFGPKLLTQPNSETGLIGHMMVILIALDLKFFLLGLP